MAIPNPTQCCFYRIQEGTKNEFVAVGSNGNILRWQDTGGKEQQWLVIPIDEVDCLIMTRSNGEYMAVGSNGNILRWGFTGGPEQQFSFVNESNGWWNIRESTKGEFVAVGFDGNILRWGKSNGTDQRFRLLPVNAAPKPAVRSGIYNPDSIPGAPKVTASNPSLPDKSPYYLIGEMTVPAVLVNDSGRFSDRVSQVEQNPYYILTRERYWDRSSGRGYLHASSGIATEIVETIKRGMTQKESTSMEQTIGTKVTKSGSLNFAAKGTVDKVELGGGGMASISHETTTSLKVTVSSDTTSIEEETRQVKVTLPAGEKVTRVGWSLVDRYSLKRKDGSLVGRWEVVDLATFVEDSFPTPSGIPNLPDGKVLREQSAAAVFVIFGGAKFHIPNPTVLHSMYGGWAAVQVVNDGELAMVPTTPRDGTVLKEKTPPQVYVIQNGKKCWISNPTLLHQKYGGWGAVRTVHDGALAAIPNGPQAQ